MKCDRCKGDKKRVYRGICQSCYKKDRIKYIQAQAPKRLCMCGCGEIVPSIGKDGKPQRFINGHQTKGELNARYRGGRTIDSYGYVNILAPTHPNRDSKGYVKEHRLIMEQYLGRYLIKDELIHHINENKQDNRIENLQLITRSKHQNTHNPRKGYRKDVSGRICLECGADTTYPSKNGQPHWMKHPITKEKWTCEKCYRRIRHNSKKISI